MGNLTVRLPAGVSIVHATRLSRTLPPPGYAMTLRCAGLFRADQRLVADNPEREAHQDRGEGHQPRPLCRLPDGRGCHSEKSVRRHPAADRRTAVAAGHIDSVKRSVVTLSIKNYGRRAYVDNRTRVFGAPLFVGVFQRLSRGCWRRRSEIARNPQTSQSGFEPAVIWRMSGGICLISLPLVCRFLTSREKVGHGSGRK